MAKNSLLSAIARRDCLELSDTPLLEGLSERQVTRSADAERYDDPPHPGEHMKPLSPSIALN